MTGILQELGLRPVINAYATLTRLGGSRMPPEVTRAMEEASRSFVDLEELQLRASERIAALTHNEAAYICSGAAAGLTISAAACVAGDAPAAIARLPDFDGPRREIVVHRSHRNGYDHAVRQVGVELVEIGDADGTTSEQMIGAFNERTAAFLWFQGAMTGHGDLPLPRVLELAADHDVPVIVDAAAQLPPVENLWAYTAAGATLAVFSGGKDLCGPQSSGLIVGRRDLIERCRLNGNPRHSIGRPMKVGKEEMAGLVAAVERYLQLDHAARANWCEAVVEQWNLALSGLPGVVARRDFPNEAGQPLPRTLVTLVPERAGIQGSALLTQLEGGDPVIAAAPFGDDGFYLNPMTLEPGEERIVLDRIVEILAASRPA